MPHYHHLLSDPVVVGLFLSKLFGKRDGGPTSALHRAAAAGNAAEVKRLLEEAAEANDRDRDGATALHCAAGVDVARVLLEAGADVNAKDNAGQTPLHRAARSGDTARVQLLLERGADPEARTTSEWTPLICAAAADAAEALHYLLTRGADIAARDLRGATALHEAARTGSTEAVRMLLQGGLEPQLRDGRGWTPLHCAVGCPTATARHRQAAALLLTAGADVNARAVDGTTPLKLIGKRDAAGFRGLLRAHGARG